MSKTKIRTDDIQRRISQPTSPYGSGWLLPQIAWAVYSQNGVIKQLINRTATLMLSKGWIYKKPSVPYDWSAVESELETLGLAEALRSCVIWMMVFGGAGIVLEVDDVFQPWDAPLDPSKVRGIKKLHPKAAPSLKPYPYDRNWANCEYFEDMYARDASRRIIHRSRVVVVVAHDVPTDLGFWGTQVYNSQTGWPPSWIESVYSSLCEWKDADKNVGTIIRTASLLWLQLKGFRKAATSPDTAEAEEVQATVEQIAENLDNEGLLTFDEGDKLGEVGRNMSGLSDLVDQKKMFFVANTGRPKELVLMEAVGNLGDNSGPIDAFHELVDGERHNVLVGPITQVTDLQLAVQRREDPDTETPTEYTVDFPPLAAQTDGELAEQNLKEAKRRAEDLKAGVPTDVIYTDPGLAKLYPGMTPWLEEREETQAAGAKVEADLPEISALESTAAIAKRLGVSQSTVRRLHREGEIRGRRVGGRWKFHWPEVWEAINASGEPAEGKAEDPVSDTRMDSILGLSESTEFGDVYGASEAMREIFAVLERVAPASLPVLITGESGTGKEGIARGLHDVGEHAGTFVALNCASLPTEPGDAAQAVEQAMADAEGGTVFLDEIGELTDPQQGALLRALSSGISTRVVSATWRDISRPWFRLDLYNRIAGIEVEVPPLRERGEDVLHLARMFYERHRESAGWPDLEEPLAPDAVAVMQLHAWPGNVRELKNAIERGALFAGPGQPLTAENLQLRVVGA